MCGAAPRWRRVCPPFVASPLLIYAFDVLRWGCSKTWTRALVALSAATAALGCDSDKPDATSMPRGEGTARDGGLAMNTGKDARDNGDDNEADFGDAPPDVETDGSENSQIESETSPENEPADSSVAPSMDSDSASAVSPQAGTDDEPSSSTDPASATDDTTTGDSTASPSSGAAGAANDEAMTQEPPSASSPVADDELVQRYLLEAILRAHEADELGAWKELTAEGIRTKGLSRYESNPRICFDRRGGDDAQWQSVRDIIERTVPDLSAGNYTPEFLGDDCYTGPECGTDAELPTDQLTVFIGCGAGSGGGSFCAEGSVNDGCAISGGRLRLGSPVDEWVVVHELGHAFGMYHTYGQWEDPLCVPDPDDTYSDIARAAIAIAYSYPSGTPLSLMIADGVIDDEANILDPPPYIESVANETTGLFRDRDTAAPGEVIGLRGRRLTVAWQTDYEWNSARRSTTLPPVVDFGGVSVVANLDQDYQESINAIAGAPATGFAVEVPSGAQPGLTLHTRGYAVSYPSFTLSTLTLAGIAAAANRVDVTASSTNAGLAPAAVIDMSCSYQPDGSVALSWGLPATRLDGLTPLGEVSARVFRNGRPLVELPGGESWSDTSVELEDRGSIYQVFLIAVDSDRLGVPSTPCAICAPSGTRRTPENCSFR